MKKAMLIAIAAISFSMRDSDTGTVTEASVPKQFAFAEENDDTIIVILRQEEVYVWKENFIEPEERTIGYYLVRDEQTMQTIAQRLEVTEEYLMSFNKDYRGEITDKLAKYALVEIPDADWRSLNDVYCLVSESNCLNQLAEYFYTSTDEILELNPDIEDANMIYTSYLIQVQ